MRAAAWSACLVVMAGCSTRLVDPCASETAACVAVQIQDEGSIEKLDSASLAVDGDGISESKTTGSGHGAVTLPVAVGLVFGDVSGTQRITITVAGILGGQVVGTGSGSTTLTGKQHVTIQITLAPGQGGAPDMAVVSGGGTGDMGPSSCQSGFHLCNGSCVDNTSVASCGTACSPCPVGNNATAATCDGTSCGLQCNSGYHVCGSMCVSNSDPASCNMSCTPCSAPSGGTATCDGTQCGGQCSSGQQLCFGACIPSGQACSGMCAAGTHDCNNLCADNTSPNSCGASCTPCPVPANATVALCTSGQCDVQCNSGYKKCGTTNPICIPNSGCCTVSDCVQPSGGSVACTNNVCAPSCNSNSTTLCNNATQCLPITGTSSCGPNCINCGTLTPANATPTCDGTSCGFTCNSGYVKQGTGCTPCGANGQACCTSGNACNTPYVCNQTAMQCGERFLTWSSQASGVSVTTVLQGVWESNNASTVYISGTEAKLMSWNGSAWVQATLPANYPSTASFLTVWGSQLSGTIYVGSASGDLLVSSGSAFVSEVNLPSAWTSSPSDIQFVFGDQNGNIYFANGTNNMLTARNGTFSLVADGTSTNTGWAGPGTTPDLYAGGPQVLHSKGGGSWSSVGLPTGAGIIYTGIWGTSQGALYVVGTKGMLLKSTVGSTDPTTFKQETLPTGIDSTYSFWGIWGSDQSGYVYVVGDQGLIMHKAVGGTWQIENKPNANNSALYCVHGALDGSDAWAVGDSGTVLHGK